MIVAVIFGVVVGTFGAYVLMVVTMINNGETYMTYADIPAFLMILLGDEEFRGAAMADILQGLLFAALGVFALLWKANKDVSGIKVENLE